MQSHLCIFGFHSHSLAADSSQEVQKDTREVTVLRDEISRMGITPNHNDQQAVEYVAYIVAVVILLVLVLAIARSRE